MKDKNGRKYYSIRAGKENDIIDLVALRKIFFNIYKEFSNKAYFNEYLECCPDFGDAGEIGDVSHYLLRKLRKDDLWPIVYYWEKYSEEDIFDLIEFLYDYVSAPTDANPAFHQFYGHYHYHNFDQSKGREEFRDSINEILGDYDKGYELEGNGEIYSLLEEEFRPLLSAKLPAGDEDGTEIKRAKAVAKFRKYGSTLDDKYEAVRMLADCLEYIRKDLKGVITNKDDSDLFSIANNFGIRHNNDKQRTNYDRAIWVSWMFYFYLVTLNVGKRFLNKEDNKS